MERFQKTNDGESSRILVALLSFKYIVLCEMYGMTSEQCISIEEFEFTLGRNNRIEYLETWSNTKRTKGYRKWDASSRELYFPEI